MKNLLLLIFALVINNQIAYGQEVTIGTQTWMQKNLNVSKYRDGTPIPQVTDPTKWHNLTTGAWCYHENKTANGTIYGKLYNGYAVAGIHDVASLYDPSLRKQIAPKGWHVPSVEEWTTLTTFLGGEKNVVDGKMKSKGKLLWKSPNTDATNSSGFTGLPAGWRNFYGAYIDVGDCSYWWSTTERGQNIWSNYYLCVGDCIGSAQISYFDLIYGFSVRCLRD